MPAESGHESDLAGLRPPNNSPGIDAKENRDLFRSEKLLIERPPGCGDIVLQSHIDRHLFHTTYRFPYIRIDSHGDDNSTLATISSTSPQTTKSPLPHTGHPPPGDAPTSQKRQRARPSELRQIDMPRPSRSREGCGTRQVLPAHLSSHQRAPRTPVFRGFGMRQNTMTDEYRKREAAGNFTPSITPRSA
ncbi:hypothetical protein BDB13_5702 [Rhodococcus sp. OK302]|nr:hypothetical protein BDB13_5702 [Rhodococcus sp. OK302]